MSDLPEFRYVYHAERLWSMAQDAISDGWRGRPDEFVQEVKRIIAAVQADALAEGIALVKATADKWESGAGRASYLLQGLIQRMEALKPKETP